MSDPGGGRRAVAIALFALAAGAIGVGAYARRGGDQVRAAVGPAATALAGRAQSHLMTVAKALEPAAADAARVRELLAAFDNGVDAATFQDALESEDWWRGYRGEDRASAVFVRDRAIATLFVEEPPPPIQGLAAMALADRVASGFVAGRGRIYVAAAARVERSQRAAAARAAIVVARALDAAAVGAAASSVGAALALSDGQRAVSTAGDSAALGVLAGVIGREGGPAIAFEDAGTAVPVALGPGAWLWVLAPPDRSSPGSTIPVALFAIGGVLAVGGVVALRPRKVRAADVGAIPTRPTSPVTGGSARPSEIVATAGSAGSSAPLDVRPQVLGRYSLIEKIGEGGMAEVFRATLYGAEGFERPLVVKRLLPVLAGNKEAIAQFIDEARLQAALSHSNVVQVFDFGRAGSDYFLAIELIDGRDLEKVVERHMQLFGRGLDLSVAASIIHDVLSALSYAHTRTDAGGRALEIVHRDVSLANVLVSWQGEVKLSDFGIAKAERRVSKTEVGMVKGNASFMAPEQARGEPVDARADVFATGVVLFMALTGQPLYPSDGNQLLRAAVGPGTQQFESIHRLHADLSKVIARAIDPVPGGRYPSATEFARALRPFATATRDDLAVLMRTLFTEDLHRGVG